MILNESAQNYKWAADIFRYFICIPCQHRLLRQIFIVYYLKKGFTKR